MSDRPKTVINKAERLYNQYRIECNTLADWVKSKVSWSDEFNCEYFPGDGLCIVVSDAPTLVASAREIVEHIQKNGTITFKEFADLCV